MAASGLINSLPDASRYFLILAIVSIKITVSLCAVKNLGDDSHLETLGLVMVVAGGVSAPPEPLSKSAEIDAWLDQDAFPNTLLPIGVRQMFLFGRIIQSRYSKLFESDLDQNDYYFLSKSAGPEITSVQSFGQSFFEDEALPKAEEFDELIPVPFSGQKPQLNFSTPLPNGNTPFRIYSVAQKELDLVFGLDSITACPNLNIREFTDVIEKVNKDFRFFESLETAKKAIQLNESLESIATANNLELSSRLFEWMRAQALTVKTPLFAPGSQVYEELKIAHEAYIGASQAQSNLLKIVQAPAVQTIGNALYAFYKSPEKKPLKRKLHMSLGHEKFMVGIMMVLGLTKPECFYDKLKHYTFGTPYKENKTCPEYPGPTSNLIFEVLKEAGDPNSEIYVRLRYNGDIKNFIFNIPENEDLTLLEDVLGYLQSGITNPKWRSECGLDDDQSNKSNYDLTRWIIYFLLWTIGLGTAFTVIVWLFYFRTEGESSSANTTEVYEVSSLDEHEYSLDQSQLSNY